jgi:hypothetical protein
MGRVAVGEEESVPSLGVYVDCPGGYTVTLNRPTSASSSSAVRARSAAVAAIS